jgi:Late exocytosis, associated with Golgi transport
MWQLSWLLRCFAVVPVHLNGSEVNKTAGASQSKLAFVRFTIANLDPRSRLDPHPTYWLHFALSYLFVFYAMWLIKHHYQVRASPHDLRQCLFGLWAGRIVVFHGGPARLFSYPCVLCGVFAPAEGMPQQHCSN